MKQKVRTYSANKYIYHGGLLHHVNCFDLSHVPVVSFLSHLEYVIHNFFYENYTNAFLRRKTTNGTAENGRELNNTINEKAILLKWLEETLRVVHFIY